MKEPVIKGIVGYPADFEMTVSYAQRLIDECITVSEGERTELCNICADMKKLIEEKKKTSSC